MAMARKSETGEKQMMNGYRNIVRKGYSKKRRSAEKVADNWTEDTASHRNKGGMYGIYINITRADNLSPLTV